MNQSDRSKVERMIEARVNKLQNSIVSQLTSLNKAAVKIDAKIDSREQIIAKELEKKSEMLSVDYNKQINALIASFNKYTHSLAKSLDDMQKDTEKNIEKIVIELDYKIELIERVVNTNLAASQKHEDEQEKKLLAYSKNISDIRALQAKSVSELNSGISKNQAVMAFNTKEMNNVVANIKKSIAATKALNQDDNKKATERTKKELEAIRQSHAADMENVAGQLNAYYGESIEQIKTLQNNTSKSFQHVDNKSAKLQKEVNFIRTNYSTMDILAASMKKLHESVNTELIKANIALDRFRQECATNENMYRLREELENQEKQQAEKVNKVLRELHSITSNEQKKLSSAIDKLNNVESLSQKTQYGTDTRIQEISEELESKHAELSEDVLEQNAKLYQHIDKGLTSLRKDLEKEMDSDNKSTTAQIAKLKTELFNTTETKAEDLSASINLAKAEMSKALASAKAGLTQELNTNKTAAEKENKNLSNKLDSLDSSLERFSQKSEIEATESWNKLVDAIDDARDEAQNQVLSYTKNLQKKFDTDMAKFREKQGNLLNEEVKRNTRRYAALDKESSEQSDRFTESIARLDKLVSEYREANEADKKALGSRIDSELSAIKTEITQMHKFEDSLAVLNEERSQLMAMMDSFCQLKIDINKQEDDKLARFGDYVREKSNEFHDTIQVAQKIKAKKAKKSKPLPPKPKKPKILEPRDIEGQVQLLKNQGMNNEQIINVFRSEYGEYKVGKVKKFLRSK